MSSSISGLGFMNTETASRRHTASIASLVPGRLRLKLHRHNRDSRVLDHIKNRLESQAGVNHVRTNAANGSVTVHYDATRHSTAGILGWLEDLDLIVESIGHLPSINGGDRQDSAGFLAAVGDLNGRVRHAAGFPVDIKLVLPLAFLSAGIWSIARRGLMIEAVPGWLLLWFAFDIFVKLHPNHVRSASPTEHA